MKILIRQMLGSNHSWCTVGHGFARAFKRMGHELDLVSTNGSELLPEDLKENLIYSVNQKKESHFEFINSKEYDVGLSYTLMPNFHSFLQHCNSKFGIWCYEWAGKNTIPTGFAEHYKSVNRLLPPSQFAKQIFLDSNVPDSSIMVLPHGITPEEFKNAKSLSISSKKFKIGMVLGQLHKRKNIKAAIEAYTKTFTIKDDVSLIIKIPQSENYSYLRSILSSCKENSPEIKIVYHYIPVMADFYASVDATFTMSHAECFYFPALESLAFGILPIAPNYGGQLDFLNENNSLLIDGDIVNADPASMYWEAKPSLWFEPSLYDACLKLREAYDTFETRNDQLKNGVNTIHQLYSWDNIATTLLNCKETL